MLAFTGFIFTDFYTLPGFEYTTLEAHDACVASGSMSQLLLWIGLLEVIGFIGIDQTLRGSGREAGDFGFDPVGFASDPKKKADLQMKEIANGRLAMFAFGGVVTQSVLTGNTFPYLFGDATTFGSVRARPPDGFSRIAHTALGRARSLRIRRLTSIVRYLLTVDAQCLLVSLPLSGRRLRVERRRRNLNAGWSSGRSLPARARHGTGLGGEGERRLGVHVEML